MHILLGILSSLGALVFILWRINIAIQVTREIADAADSAKGFFRRHKWRRKVNADQLKQITDPREAAATMLVAIAEADGAITENERQKIITIFIDKFEATTEQAEELLGISRWRARNAGDLTSFLNRLTPSIIKSCSQEQKQELIIMLRDVANADGPQPSDVGLSISQIKRYISV